MKNLELLDAACEPTVKKLRKLAGRMPPPVRALLDEIADQLCALRYSVTGIRRAAQATDWHVKLFQRELGVSPRDLIRECRLEIAMVILRDSSLTVHKVADLVGYGTQRPLERLFRKFCEFTPSQARHHLRRVRPELRAKGLEFLSWHFWVRYHRGEVGAEELADARTYHAERFGPPEPSK